MFQLFKKRDFSANISDTITFFKTFGKHYFKNYFTINGIFLLLLVILLYFIGKVYMEFIFSMSANQKNPSDYLSTYFNDNVPIFILIFVVFIFLTVFLSIINLAYPVIYLQFLEENGEANFGLSEIIKALKANASKLIVFFFGLLFIITPILFIVFALNLLLCFIIIGIPLLFVTMPAAMSWISLSFHDYLNNDIGFFEALGNGFSLLKQNFWPIVGTTLAVLIILQVVQGIITMIPYVIGLVFVFASTSGGDFANGGDNSLSSLAIVFSIILVFSVLLGYTFNNIIFINQGLIYYSLREENEQNTTKSQIDLIGTDSE